MLQHRSGVLMPADTGEQIELGVSLASEIELVRHHAYLKWYGLRRLES